jgi:hypothetical protein
MRESFTEFKEYVDTLSDDEPNDDEDGDGEGEDGEDD